MVAGDSGRGMQLQVMRGLSELGRLSGLSGLKGLSGLMGLSELRGLGGLSGMHGWLVSGDAAGGAERAVRGCGWVGDGRGCLEGAPDGAKRC